MTQPRALRSFRTLAAACRAALTALMRTLKPTTAAERSDWQW